MSGVMQLPWNFQMVAMGGFGLFLMANLLLCTPVAAQREVLTAQVSCRFKITSLFHTLSKT